MFTTVTHPHVESKTVKPCSAQDIILVHQGLQCTNCLALVQEYVWVDESEKEENENRKKNAVGKRENPIVK
jgi:hypothetical protein